MEVIATLSLKTTNELRSKLPKRQYTDIVVVGDGDYVEFISDLGYSMKIDSEEHLLAVLRNLITAMEVDDVWFYENGWSSGESES